MANQEAENSDDSDYVNRILNANETMKLALPVMIHKAKLLATQPDVSDHQVGWSNSNQNVKETFLDRMRFYYLSILKFCFISNVLSY